MLPMKFTPYKEVLEICCRSLEAPIARRYRRPERARENRLGSKELIYVLGNEK
jgi:hypothetical protein